MLWYGVEPLLASDPSAVELLERARIPLVRRFAARRLALEADPGSSGGAGAGYERLIETLGRTEDAEGRIVQAEEAWARASLLERDSRTRRRAWVREDELERPVWDAKRRLSRYDPRPAPTVRVASGS